jgi:uncharacterized membrane protein (UPF0136 family)
VLWGLFVPAFAIGVTFLVGAVVVDLAARRWREMATVELLAGVALLAVPAIAAVLTLRGKDAMVPLIVSSVILAPGTGLLRAGSFAARRGR